MRWHQIVFPLLLAAISAGAQDTNSTPDLMRPFDWNTTLAFIRFPTFVAPATVGGETYNFKNLLAQAEKGDPTAQRLIGDAYYEGTGAKRSYETAFRWYTRAARQNEPVSQNNLGVMYLDGKSFPQNFDEAFKWFKRSSENNCATAHYHLGLLYEFGFGVVRDRERAKRLLEQAADQLLPEAELRLAIYHAVGEPWVRKQNYVKAYELACLAFAHGREGNDVFAFREYLRARLTKEELRQAQQRTARLMEEREERGPDAVVILGPR